MNTMTTRIGRFWYEVRFTAPCDYRVFMEKDGRQRELFKGDAYNLAIRRYQSTHRVR